MDVQLKIALAIMAVLAAQALVVGLITFVKLLRVPGLTRDGGAEHDETERFGGGLRHSAV